MPAWFNLTNKVSDHASVSVASSLTILVGAFQIAPYDSTFFELTNTDVSQSLTAQLEASASASGPWFVFDSITFASIAAGATVNGRFAGGGFNFVRFRGIASGAGLTATVTATQFHTGQATP